MLFKIIFSRGQIHPFEPSVSRCKVPEQAKSFQLIAANFMSFNLEGNLMI